MAVRSNKSPCLPEIESEVVDAVPRATLAADGRDVFADPRSDNDRRQNHDPKKIPATGCRRKTDRRTMVYIKSDNWWMKRNYNNGM